MTQTIHFLSGLPRSGSTILSAILNQNPCVYVTPTSPLLELLVRNKDAYKNIDECVANPNFDQLTNMTRAMIKAAWEHRPEPYIIDKNRGWMKNMPASTILFEREVKIVCTVRDLPSIMASWLTLIRSYPYLYDQSLMKNGFMPTDENRVMRMWTHMTRDCMEGLHVVKKTAANRLLIVNYDDFMAEPLKTIRSIEKHLELPYMEKYDFENIEKLEEDNDLKAWGFPNLHTIRPKLGKTSQNAKDVLGHILYDRFVELEKDYV